MKILINKKIIKSLKPCADRYENYLKHYPDFEGYLEEFLDLEHISHSDKIWVSMHVMPRFLVEVFAIDCATIAADYAAYAAYIAADAAAYATYANAAYATNAYIAADAAAYATYANAAYATNAYIAADAAAYVADFDERQRQIESIIYLVQSHEEN